MAGGYRHKKGRLSKTAIIWIIVLAVVVYAGILLGVQLIGSRIESENAQEPVGSLEGRFIDNRATIDYGGRTLKEKNVTNILLIGVDWDEDEPEGYRRYAGQSDFLLLLTIDSKAKTISSLQLDRDTITDVRTYGPFGDYTGTVQTQICLAYAYGSNTQKNCENAVWSVRNYLGGIEIDGYVTLDMQSIALFNDALGGVTVKLDDDFSRIDPEMQKGSTITLHGIQAQYFVRGRKAIGDGLNTSRMRRQRVFIQSAQELLLEGMKDDMAYAGRVYDALEGHIQTDRGRGWLINKAYECCGYTVEDIRAPIGEHYYGADGYMEFHPDEDALNSLLTTLFYE